MDRIGFLDYGILMAQAAAMRAEDLFVKVGAVGFDKNKRIVATGYNGYQQGVDVPTDIQQDRDLRRKYIIHAENNLFARCKRGDIHYLFLTLTPCEMCAKTIVAHNIQEVYYAEIYDKCDAYRELFKFYDIVHGRVMPKFKIEGL